MGIIQFETFKTHTTHQQYLLEFQQPPKLLWVRTPFAAGEWMFIPTYLNKIMRIQR